MVGWQLDVCVGLGSERRGGDDRLPADCYRASHTFMNSSRGWSKKVTQGIYRKWIGWR
jgi:hypothetical protein